MKKTVSILLALLMIFPMCALFAFAGTAEGETDALISLNKKAFFYTKNAANDADYLVKDGSGATDGATADNWVRGEFGEMYAQIDLQFVCTVTAVNVKAYTGYNHAWSVYLSTDGETFAKAAEVEKTVHPAEGITASFSAANARYVRVYADFYVTNKQFSFREISVYGAEPDHPDEPAVSGGKSALLHTKNAKTDAEYVNKNLPGLTDGNLNSDNWAYGDFGEMYAQVDLETVYNVSAVNFVGYPNIKQGWSVYVSTDGDTFTYAGGCPSISHPAAGVTDCFDPVPARYVRVVADYYPTSQQISFREVTVYGSIPPAPLYPYAGEITATLPDLGTTGSLTNGVLDDDLSISGACGGYMTVDLKGVVSVDKVDVYAYENNSEYTVFGSADGAAWTVIGYKELNSAAYDSTTGYGKSFPAEGSWRYIRVQWAKSTRNDGYLTIKEIDVFNGESEYTDVAVSNINCIYNNANADDGNYGNYNFCKKAGGALLLDLGEVKDVRKVEFFASAFTPFSVERSEDGTTYKPFGRVLTMTGGSASLELDYSATRYLRLTGLLGDALSLAEITVYTPDAPETPEGLADPVVLDGGSYVVPAVNALGETVTSLAFITPSLTGSADLLTVPAHVTDLAGAFDSLTVGKLILKNASYGAESVAAAAASGAQIYAAMNEDGNGTLSDLIAAGAPARNLLEAYANLLAGTKNGVNYLKAVGVITAEDLDYERLVLTAEFKQNGTLIKTKSAEIRNVFKTVKGCATVSESVSSSQGIDLIDGAYLCGISVNGIPAGSYEVSITLTALTSDASGDLVTVASQTYEQQIAF